MFFSGIPFGPSLFYLFSFGLMAAGAVVAIVGRKRWAGVALVAISMALLMPQFWWENVELNPVVRRPDLIGVWTDGSNRLTLEENGEYVLLWNEREVKGTWTNDDYNLLLSPDVGYLNFYPRIVQVKSRYRIVTNYCSIDTWDGDLGLAKL